MVFSSCDGGESEITTEPEIIETEAPETPPINITKGGATEYKLIRSEKASSTVTDAFCMLFGRNKKNF
jgi:hypothetical protein